jgi:NDP-sugar pyrophosphorylase family protein
MAIAEIDVAVLAGGLGMRLRGILPETPKILAPVLGRPFVEHLLNWLIGQGARRVILCLGYRAEDVLTYLETHSFASLEIHPVVEPEPLGTGGALAYARSLLCSDPVLVVNGDTIVGVDLNTFLAAHRASRAEASILCAAVEDAGRYGRMEIDAKDRVVRFVEKDSTDTGPAWINAGFYLLGRAVMHRIAPLSQGSLERDILQSMAPHAIYAFRTSGQFLDIGTPETLALAPEVLKS